jgi:hypothetical protein
MKLINFLQLLTVTKTVHGINDKSHGEYAILPTLREQAALKDEWTKSRIETIPALLNKYGVDAWLVCSIFLRCYYD